MDHKIEKIDTRSTLAFIWSIAAIYFFGYILHKHSDRVEILTLMIGMLGGTIIGAIFGTYFNADVNKKPPAVIPPDANIQTLNTDEISGPVTTKNLNTGSDVTKITES